MRRFAPTAKVTSQAGLCYPAAMKFQFDETKGVEALTYIAAHWPNITPFFASKVLYFAEKAHLNRYGRPIAADTFVAMTNGPVPATLYDFIKGQLGQAGDPAAVLAALDVSPGNQAMQINARRPANLDYLSPSDVECLDEALAFCRHRSFRELSNLTHQDRAWREAAQNAPMDYRAMISDDNPNRDALLEDVAEFAAHGAL